MSVVVVDDSELERGLWVVRLLMILYMWHNFARERLSERGDVTLS